MLSQYFYVQIYPARGILIPLEHTVGAIALTSEQICPIPGISPALLGVVNQRGSLLWVLELSDLLGLGQSPKSLSKYNLTLLVLTARGANGNIESEPQVGCVVSVLKEIVFLNPEQFKSIPADSPIRSFLSGVAEIEQSLVSVLNVNAVFAALSNLDTFLGSS